MAQSKPYVTMMKGLITESSPLTPVEGSFFEGSNFIIDNKNNITRRKGLELVDSLVSFAGGRVFTYKWEGADNGKDMLVTAVIANDAKGTLSVLFNTETSQEYLQYSGASSYALELFRLDLNDKQTKIVNFANAGSTLIITTDAHYPIMFKKSLSGSGFDVVTAIIPLERDLEGVKDGVADSERPAESNRHNYNLYNQGWPAGHIVQFRTEIGKDPSNSDLVSLGKYVDSNGDEGWRAVEITKSYLGNTPAPKGKWIRNVFKDSDVGFSGDLIKVINVSQAGNLLTITFESNHNLVSGDFFTLYSTNGRGVIFMAEGGKVDVAGNIVVINMSTVVINSEWTLTPASPFVMAMRKHVNPVYWALPQLDGNGKRWVYNTFEGFEYETRSGFTSVAAWSSRFWFAGLTGKKASRIYFSQTIVNDKSVDKLYSINDPSSEINDVLKSDGGYVIIPEVTQVVSLFPTKDSLIVLAKNGVWSISGTVNGVFSATDYQVDKISSFGCISSRGVCELNGVVYYIGTFGIYAFDGKDVLNITEKSVSNVWTVIPTANLTEALLIPNNRDETVHMIYSDYGLWKSFDKELVYNSENKNIYTMSYSSDLSRYIIGAYLTKSQIEHKQIAYICVTPSIGGNSVLGVFTNTHGLYTDFRSTQSPAYAGTPYTSILKSAVDNVGELSKTKTAAYIKLFKRNSPNNKFTFKAVWDWMKSGTTKREQVLFANDKYDETYPSSKTHVAILKDSMSGYGDSMYIHIESVEGKDCSIYGWSVDWSARSAT